MRILSNEYLSNLPSSKNITQGGPANFANLFSKYLNKTGHQWIGVSMKKHNSDTVRLRTSYSTLQKQILCLYFPTNIFNTITHAKSKKIDPVILLKKPIDRLVLLIKKEKPDIVFLNGYSLSNWVLLKAAEATKTPVVIQHAGIWTKELEVYRNSIPGYKILQKMEQDSTNLSQFEIFLNTWSRDYYSKNVAAGDGSKIKIVPLPFDFTNFIKLSNTLCTSQFNFDRKYFHIGMIGRWDEIKNHRGFLSLAKKSPRIEPAMEVSFYC